MVLPVLFYIINGRLQIAKIILPHFKLLVFDQLFIEMQQSSLALHQRPEYQVHL